MKIYMLGIGGIGMSAIARYFLHEGRQVAGYDRTPTPLTAQLENEGARIHYDDGAELIPPQFRNPADTLVVYTPAVPADHPEMVWFRQQGFRMEKRSEMLGHISQGKYVMAVAGTHGKTTTTTLVAWLNHNAACDSCGSMASAGGSRGGSAVDSAVGRHNGGVDRAAENAAAGCGCGNAVGRREESSAEGCGVESVAGRRGEAAAVGCGSMADDGGCGGGSAFLGGISKNFDSNLVLGSGNRIAVEADEFDRSFLRLHPDVAAVTSADADHLDIYGTHQALKEAFAQFVRQIRPGGALIIKQGVEIDIDNPQITLYRYSLDEGGDFCARNITLLEGGYYRFDIVCPDRVIGGCTLGIPGLVNVENAVAAVGMMWVAGFDQQRLKDALASYRGVRRRFEFRINSPRLTYIDDYAHHPRELTSAITSIRRMFPGRRMTAVFQPHLYTRTRDFYREFGQALSLADEVVLIPIYPAREEPIEGVASELIAKYITVPCSFATKASLAATLAARSDLDVVVTFGAGDIENCCPAVEEALREKYGAGR